MTALLVILFISVAISVELISERKRNRAIRFATKPTTSVINGTLQDIFVHEGMVPTMADGGEKIEKKEEDKK